MLVVLVFVSGACSFTSAKKDNDFVYHERVPEVGALEPIAPVLLAKAQGFDARAKDVLQGDDLFRRLLPLEVHSAASLYSEEKAKLLRTVTLEISGKNKVLECVIFTSLFSSSTGKLQYIFTVYFYVF